jgi:energy-coupling factor transporter ATP-binding protein EcfA2
VVVGASSGVGKTTLVTALCELLPAETRRLYIRGCFEDFAFLRDSAIEANRSALLVNELSPHLPVYLWGPGVAEVLRATERGFMVLASAHASSALEFVATLAGSPLQLNPRLIAAFRVVISVGSEEPLSPQARITGVWRMLPTRSGVAIDALAARGLPTGTTPDRAWFPPVEISERMQLLATFAAGREPLPTVVRILPDDDEQRIGGVAP